MKRTSAQLKQSARMALNGKYGTPMAGFLLLAVIAVSLYMLSTALFGGYSISTMVMEQVSNIMAETERNDQKSARRFTKDLSLFGTIPE